MVASPALALDARQAAPCALTDAGRIPQTTGLKCSAATLLLSLGLAACVMTPQAPPGDNLQFLRLARYIADNVRIADPVAVGRALQTHLTGQLDEREIAACRKTAVNPQTSFTQFSADPDFWFVAKPGGTIIKYMAGPDISNPNTKVEERTLEAPQLDYLLVRTKTCSGVGPAPAHADVPARGLITATHLSFNNIPGYACISIGEVQAIFPHLTTPNWTDTVPPLQYIGRRNTADFYLGGGDFKAGQSGNVRHQPACLISLGFEPHIPRSELRGE